jgi:hypothetical protein
MRRQQSLCYAHLNTTMRMDFLTTMFFYGGPDQIMTVTSGLASALGILLIFWNKMTGLFFRVVRGTKASTDAAPMAEKHSIDTH